MCELPLPSEADLIRRDMMQEIPAEGLKIHVNLIDTGTGPIQEWMRTIRPLLDEENPWHFGKEA